jgi:LysM repeat protein
MKKWLVVFTVFCAFQVIGQPGVAPTETVNGKKYYIHIVQAGNTLWGIKTLYNVSVESILEANPETQKGLLEGQRLLIPLTLVSIVHEVQRKETLFAISRKYGVTVASIIAINPEIEAGIRTGQKITIPGVELQNGMTPAVESPTVKQAPPAVSEDSKLPQVKVSFSDTIIQHVVLPHETLYSISKRFMVPLEELQRLNNMRTTKIKPGESIKIPVKKEKIEPIKIREIKKVEKQEKRKVDSTLLYPKKSNYRIALFLPFFLDKAEGSSVSVSDMASEFYMGAKLALDSLDKLGLKAEVFVYDSRNDSSSIQKILSKPEMKDMDVVFGPLFPDNLSIVANWCKANKIKMVCPASANPGILKGNPYVFNAIPSDATLLKGLAEFTLKNNASDQIILIKSTNEKDLAMHESFRTTFLTAPSSAVRPKLIDATLDNYSSFLKKNGKIVIVFPTNDKILANKFMNSLNTASQKLNEDAINVYGTKEWQNFDALKQHEKNKFNFHYSSPNDLNYAYPNTKKLHLKYRSEYNSDMTKMAVQGFDVVFAFCSDFLLRKKSPEMVMNTFNLQQKGADNGFENVEYFILKQENFEIINVQRK